MRAGPALPGWLAVSRMKCARREPGDPTGTIDGSSMGMPREGRLERGVELRSEVGPAHSTSEKPEGNEGVEGRGWREGSPLEGGTVRTQSRGALLPHLQRVYDAARHDNHARFTALLHHVDVVALTRAFRRLKRGASAGIDGVTVTTYEQWADSAEVDTKLNPVILWTGGMTMAESKPKQIRWFLSEVGSRS